MRRILLVLTFMSFAAWSQPAQQQAQAPIAVKVETPPPPPKTLPNYLQQFGPLLAACVAVGVAFMQRYPTKATVEAEPFEKRWDVYRDLGSHINTIVHQTSQNSPDWSKLLDPIDQMEHAQFLFGKEVVRFICELASTQLKAQLDLTALQDYVASTPKLSDGTPASLTADHGYLKLKASHTETLATLNRLSLERRTIFEPYLQLHYWENPVVRLINRANGWMRSRSGILSSRYDQTQESRQE